MSAIGESRVRVRGDRGPARNVRSGRGRGAHLHPGNAVVARGGHLLPSGVRGAGAEVGSILRAAKSPESISERPCLAETALGGARVRGSGADGEAQEQHDPRKGHPGRAPGRVGRTPFPRAVVWGKRSMSPTLRTFRVWMIFGKYREILFRAQTPVPGSTGSDRSFQSKLPRHHFEKRISAELFHGAKQ